MITELDAGTIANLPGWDYPLPASQVHEILEQACTPGIYRVSLADRNGRARLRARHGAIGDARRLGEPRDMVEVSAPVVLRGDTVAVVRVAGAPDESTALEDAARLTAARLGDAWTVAFAVGRAACRIAAYPMAIPKRFPAVRICQSSCHADTWLVRSRAASFRLPRQSDFLLAALVIHRRGADLAARGKEKFDRSF